mmetsp:Transcript_9671/g.23813  ORF Transcript_9671/g.23813 Transcript_9671/m.23813 type:complete len:235 (+) Transcript_9671:364-1068(+)
MPACLIGSCCASHAFVQIPPVMREVRVRLREAEVAPLRQRSGRAAGDAPGQRHRDLPKLIRLLGFVFVDEFPLLVVAVERAEHVPVQRHVIPVQRPKTLFRLLGHQPVHLGTALVASPAVPVHGGSLRVNRCMQHAFCVAVLVRPRGCRFSVVLTVKELTVRPIRCGGADVPQPRFFEPHFLLVGLHAALLQTLPFLVHGPPHHHLVAVLSIGLEHRVARHLSRPVALKMESKS